VQLSKVGTVKGAAGTHARESSPGGTNQLQSSNAKVEVEKQEAVQARRGPPEDTAAADRWVMVYQPHMEPTSISRSEEPLILQKLLGEHQTKCTDYTGAVPHVTSVINGSFTSNRKEKLYTIHFVDCSSAHYNNYGKTRVYIVQEGKVVFDAPSEWSVAIKSIDVAGRNGGDQWVMKNAFCNQGVCVESASVNGVGDGQMIEYLKFDSVYESNCGGIDEEKVVKYQTIHFLFSANQFDPVVIPTSETRKCGPKD
jgi:hypothetical protein